MKTGPGIMKGLFLITVTLCLPLISFSQIKCHDPVWSPDGSMIAFYAGEGEDYDVFVVNRDGKNLRKIADSEANDGGPAWSPDGNKLIFTSNRAARKSELYLYNFSTDEIRRLTFNSFSESAPSWSPDGRYIAFESKRDKIDDIYLFDTTTGEIKNITNTLHRDFRPQWSSDGNKIYFQSNRSGKYQIYKMNNDGSEVVRVFETNTHMTTPNLLPDGEKLVVVHHQDFANIEVWDLNSDHVEVLTDSIKSLMLPSFSPEGKEIVFVLMEGGNSEIYLIDYASRAIKPLLKEGAIK